MNRLGCALGALTFALAFSESARAQSSSVVDVCSGLRVNLPALQPVAGAASGLLGGLLDPLLNGIVGDVNANLRDALSGQSIGVSALDQNGNLLSTPGSCGLKANGVTVEAPGGMALGGGRIDGLGGSSNPGASAADANAIALGNGATTNASATAGVAIGLRGTASAADAIAIGRDATASAAGGIALGAGSIALRPGLNGGAEAFSGAVVTSDAGAVSIGSVGGERQIVNVAGGVSDTDAVNVRQLRSASHALAGALGGGAAYSATGAFTGPTYTIGGGAYGDVGSALAALDAAGGAIASDNTSNAPRAAATGADSLAAGYGASAAGARSVAIGANASADADGAVAIGAGARATRAQQVAIGTAASTYTLAGVTSAASRSAQSGPTQVVTTDAAGNLASMPIDLGAINSRIATTESLVAATRREARQGVAAAMAMGSAPMPSAPGKTSWSGSTATFKGEWAAGFSVAHRLRTTVPIMINAGVSLSGGSFGGARFGVAGEF